MMSFIRRFRAVLVVAFIGVMLFIPGKASADVAGVIACDPNEGAKNTFLNFPHWYEYIHTGKKLDNPPDSPCNPELSEGSDGGISPTDIWLIVLAVVGMLLRLTGIAALGMVIFGGFKYITSQGNPDATKGARQTIINAFIGVVIAIIAAVSVNFGAHLLQK